MAKAALSSGGGGTCGEPVSIPAWLIEKAQDLKPPAGSWTIYEFMRETGFQRKQARTVLGAELAAGRIVGKKYRLGNGGNTWYYWEPSKKRRTRV